jgi:hypothetical protein
VGAGGKFSLSGLSFEFSDISGYVLGTAADAEDAANISQSASGTNNRHGGLSESAGLLELRRRFRNGTNKLNSGLEQALKNMQFGPKDFFGLPDIAKKGCQYTVADYVPECKSGSTQDIRVLIEWYPFPEAQNGHDAYALRQLARTRMAQLAYLRRPSQKPSTLRTPNALGYVEHDQLCSFGLVSTLPTGSSSPLEPVILRDLLNRKPAAQVRAKARSPAAPVFPLPTLEQRYHLAATLDLHARRLAPQAVHLVSHRLP